MASADAAAVVEPPPPPLSEGPGTGREEESVATAAEMTEELGGAELAVLLSKAWPGEGALPTAPPDGAAAFDASPASLIVFGVDSRVKQERKSAE